MTCLCNQIFLDAESLVSLVYPNSPASSFLALRLLSRSSSFIRSTMAVRQLSCCEFDDAKFVSTASTSTASREGEEAAAPVAAGPVFGCAAGVAAAASWLPKILDTIEPKYSCRTPAAWFETKRAD